MYKMECKETLSLNVPPGRIQLTRENGENWVLLLDEGHSEYEGIASIPIPNETLSAISELFTDAWLKTIN